ncbi:hypothetical protein L1049_015176 [Liquidambar formosana]|uniref:Uncharacterized protein n=1 Tax=Liquidambar formosana TaxID=63359 RepID=A0AAP0S4C9_LIQFO
MQCRKPVCRRNGGQDGVPKEWVEDGVPKVEEEAKAKAKAKAEEQWIRRCERQCAEGMGGGARDAQLAYKFCAFGPFDF